jgi:tetrahydromethanopterin S-methyltransferase subunit F
MSETHEKIAQDINRALERTLDSCYASIDALTEKSSRFLQFSVILNSLLATYSGTIFFLAGLNVAVLTLSYFVYLTMGCLIGAVVCLLIVTVIASISLSPKKVGEPAPDEIDGMRRIYITFNAPIIWYIRYTDSLVDAIKYNRQLIAHLRRNVMLSSILTVLASVLLIGFIILTLILAIGNVSHLT